MTYKMRPFEAKSIERTTQAWIDDLATCESIFPADVTAIAEYINTNAVYDDSSLDSIAYGIFPEGKTVQNQAVAVVKVIVSRTGRRWVKMIDCHLRPKIEEGSLSEEAATIETVSEIYAAAIVGATSLSVDHGAGTVKVYARTKSLLHAITATAHFLKNKVVEQKIPLKVSIEGRWLVLKESK